MVGVVISKQPAPRLVGSDRITSTAHTPCHQKRDRCMSASQAGKAIADALQRRFGESFAVDENLSGLDELARMAGRRVHRRYTDRAVEPSLLRLLCACALSSPSKSDLQQADIVILEKPEQTVIADLIPDQPFIRTAPAF